MLKPELNEAKLKQSKKPMQKMNLKLGGIKALLSKEQMKKVTGGYTDGGYKPTCQSGPCSVTRKVGDKWVTEYGSCMIEVEGNPVYGIVTYLCRCSAYGGDKVTSNGGVSRCAS